MAMVGCRRAICTGGGRGQRSWHFSPQHRTVLEGAQWLNKLFQLRRLSDFVPIENVWSVPRAWCRKMPHWDEKTTKELVLEGWEEVPQDFINELVKTIPGRYQDCMDGHGQMTAW
ncbi:hypothetical protein BGZ57DRAFT_880779 [Hyaloscypha finlandica]|nr:hypothetical protein BGZ57DRAFT_880779 [Hyaloscypha finlandica]